MTEERFRAELVALGYPNLAAAFHRAAVKRALVAALTRVLSG